jgi:hypothetical protein
MNDLTPIQPPMLSIAYSAVADLTVELAKVLALVAPISMSVEQQELWLRAAVDALEDIRPQEVAAISAELRRTVTRPSQIVPEIAKLVAEKRKRPAYTENDRQGLSEFEIDREAQRRRSIARGRDEIEAAWEWERSARGEAGLHVQPIQKPLTAAELNAMPSHIASLGIKYGFLERRNGQLAEA